MKVGPKDQFITERRAKLKNLFDEYLETGGFPERVIYEKEKYFRSYIKV